MLVKILKYFGVSPDIFHVFFIAIVVLGSLTLFVLTRLVDHVFFKNKLKTQVLIIDALCIPTVILMIDIFVFNIFSSNSEEYKTTYLLTTSLLWLTVAWLFNRSMHIFVWNGLFKRIVGTECPRLLRGFISAVVYLIVIYVVLTFVYKKTVTGLLIPTGIVAGVLGLALQNMISSMFSSLAIAFEHPYRVGDWIEFPDGVLGKVIDITWRSTRLLSHKNGVYIIPNNIATNCIIHNYGLPDKKYAQWYHISIDGDVSPKFILQLLVEATLNCNKILQQPAPIAQIVDISTRPYKYMVYVHFREFSENWQGRSDLFLSIQNELMKHGIAPWIARLEVTRRHTPKLEIETPTLETYLQESQIFKSLSLEDIQILSKRCHVRTYQANKLVIKEGDKGTSLFIIVSGMLNVIKGSNDKQIEIARLYSGTEFGEMSLLTGGHRSASVKTHTNATLIEVPKESLQELLNQKPQILDILTETMAKRRAKNEGFSGPIDGDQKGKAEFIRYTHNLLGKIKTFFEIHKTAREEKLNDEDQDQETRIDQYPA